MSRAAARRSKPQASERPALHLVPENEPAVKWAEYLRIEPGLPGILQAGKVVLGTRLQTVSCILLFDVLKEGKILRLEPFRFGSTAVPGNGPRLAGAHSTYQRG